MGIIRYKLTRELDKNCVNLFMVVVFVSKTNPEIFIPADGLNVLLQVKLDTVVQLEFKPPPHLQSLSMTTIAIIYSKYESYTHSYIFKIRILIPIHTVQNMNTNVLIYTHSYILQLYVVSHSYISLILYLTYRRLCLGNKEVACACRNMAYCSGV